MAKKFGAGCGLYLLVVLILANGVGRALEGLGVRGPYEVLGIAGVVYLILLILVGIVVGVRRRQAAAAKMQKEEEHRQRLLVEGAQMRLAAAAKKQKEEERRQRAQQRAEELRRKQEREEQERAEQIEAMLERDILRENIHYMDGLEFEDFMANVLAEKGYYVETTPPTGDQGVDLLLTIDGRKVAVQLKRYTGGVGNRAVQEVVAGMFYYNAREAWVITTGTFTKGAIQLAKSNRVRLIDGKELVDWLSDLREEADNPFPQE